MSFKDNIFRQILQIVPGYDFEKAVKLYNGEHASKGFTCKDQLIAMLFAQLSGQTGLRGIENGLQANRKSLYHLGVKNIKRSTLSYANSKRSEKIFESLFNAMLSKTLDKTRSHKLKFKNPLYSVDATVIDLCLSLYDWAHFRKKKGGIKLHVKLDHKGYIPSFIKVTTAKKHEVNVLKEMKFNKGDVVVFDRGYVDFNLFANYCSKGIYFITRLKSNADYKVCKRNDVSKYSNISSDQIIEMKGFYTSRKCPLKLRRIRSKDPETGKFIVILTNNFSWSAKTVAAAYKERWQIEIFFKTLKQNLKIKSFLGTSRNAVMIQIWIAMIAYLLLWNLQYLSRRNWTIQSLIRLIPVVLFSDKNIYDLLDDKPPERKIKLNPVLQLELL